MGTRRQGMVMLVVALMSAACSASSGGVTASGGGTAGGGAVNVAMNDFTFSPAVLNGAPGQKLTIHLANSSGTEHNFTLADQKVNKDVKTGEGADVVVTVPASGQLVFVCEYHASKGMKGAIVAGAGAASPMASTSSGGGSGRTY
jgi:plastocyanin